MIFESFSVILRQISLGVHSYAVVHFPCLTKKSSKNRDLGLFGDTASNFARSTDSTPPFIFLVLRKNPSKIEILGLFGDAASNFTRSTFVRRRSFSLSYEKILQKSRFWVFSEMLRQISLGVHSYAVVHFPCLTKKSFKNRDFGSFRRCCVKFHSEYIRTLLFIFLVLRKNPSKIETLGLFRDTASNFARSTFVRRRLFSDRATKCVTHFTFNTNFNLCHSSGWRANLYKTRIV